MDEVEQLLSRVGLVYPAGQPAVLRAHAESWRELAKHLQEHQDQLGTLLAQSQGWQGENSGDFRRHAAALIESSGQAARLVDEVAVEQHRHADRHEQVLEVIKQLAIEIAVTLAYIAVAAFVPSLLAVAKTHLALLVGTAGRVLRVLAEVLDRLVGFLIRARLAIERFSRLAVRTEGFSFGYGRLLTEGAKDFAIDLAATSTSSGVQGKSLGAGKILTSAGISMGLGGVFGAIEASGVKRALTDAGAVRRGADGKPVFLSFADQYRKVLNSLGPTKPSTKPSVRMRPERTLSLDEFAAAQRHAREAGSGISAADGARLNHQVVRAKDQYQRALADQLHVTGVEERVRSTGDAVREAAARLAEAEHKLATFRTLSDTYRASGHSGGIADVEHQLSLAERAYSASTRELADSRALHETAQRELAGLPHGSKESALNVAAAARKQQRALARLAATEQLYKAADQVWLKSSLAERLAYTWSKNEWRNAFGKSRGWREYVLYEGVKDFLKGFSSNTVQGGIKTANGTMSASDIWKEGLLGGAGGSLRGIFKGRFSNVAFPNSGLEEVVWKAGTKSLDKFVRDQIRPLIESDPGSDPPA